MAFERYVMVVVRAVLMDVLRLALQLVKEARFSSACPRLLAERRLPPSFA